MKCLLAIGLAAWFGLSAFGLGCAKPLREVHVYVSDDCRIKPELVARFEKDYQCRVSIDASESEEAVIAKLKAGTGDYDLMIASSDQVRIMFQDGLLHGLRRELLPNLRHIDPVYQNGAIDPRMDHSVPYRLTYTGLAYRRSRVPNCGPTWAMFDRPDLKDRAIMLNDMREVIGAALKFLGFSLNTTNVSELAQARDVAAHWKKNLARFDSGLYRARLDAGAWWLAQGRSGDIVQLQKDNADVAFLLPIEGFSIAGDDLVIPNGAQHAELAHALINFLHIPSVAAENTEFMQYLCPNQSSYSLLSADIRDNPAVFPGADLLARGEVVHDLGANNARYARIWAEIKGAE